MAEFFFWLHIVVVIFAILSGFFLSLPLVIVLIALHKTHLVIFGDCLLTLLKRYHRAVPVDQNFWQYTSQRLFKKRMSAKTSEYLTYVTYTLMIGASLLRGVV